MADSPLKVRPPQSPLEVEEIVAEILGYVNHCYLASCRRVSKLWDQETSKLQWKDFSVKRVQCRLIPTEETLLSALENSSELFRMENSQEFMDLIQHRNPSSHDSLFSFKFDSVVAKTLIKHQVYYLRYSDPARAIYGFLVDPLVSNLVGCVELDGFFADMLVILQLLTDLPNLKSFSVDFDVATFLKTHSVIPSSIRTSPVQKLRLQLVRHANEPIPRFQDKIWDCARSILKICVNLKNLNLTDSASDKNTALDVNLVLGSLKNPVGLQTLNFQSCDSQVSADLFAIPHLSYLTSIKKLDLMNWACLPLDISKYKVANMFPPTVQYLSLKIVHTECPQELVCYELMTTGLNRYKNLKNLIIKLFPHEKKTSFNWYEKWKWVEGKLELTEATIVYDECSTVDLRPHQHLTDLKIRILKSTLTDALRVTPPNVQNLQIATVSQQAVFEMTDDDLRRDGALKAIQNLKDLRIYQNCHSCTEAVVKYVFLDMKRLKNVKLPKLKFSESQLEQAGLNLHFNLSG